MKTLIVATIAILLQFAAVDLAGGSHVVGKMALKSRADKDLYGTDEYKKCAKENGIKPDDNVDNGDHGAKCVQACLTHAQGYFDTEFDEDMFVKKLIANGFSEKKARKAGKECGAEIEEEKPADFCLLGDAIDTCVQTEVM